MNALEREDVDRLLALAAIQLIVGDRSDEASARVVDEALDRVTPLVGRETAQALLLRYAVDVARRTFDALRPEQRINSTAIFEQLRTGVEFDLIVRPMTDA